MASSPDIEVQVDRDKRPVWERENAERISSHPGLDRYVIWPYRPDEDGVKRFPAFDNMDPLPYHYFKTPEEYESAKRVHTYGGEPEHIIDLISFPSWETRRSADVILVDFTNGNTKGLDAQAPEQQVA